MVMEVKITVVVNKYRNKDIVYMVDRTIKFIICLLCQYVELKRHANVKKALSV